MEKLTSAQRRHLRGLAHHLEPAARIGKGGLGEGFFEHLDEALEHHELIKVKFADFKDRKRELAGAICERLGCAEAGRIGHVVILYRPARDPDRRKIRLPE